MYGLMQRCYPSFLVRRCVIRASIAYQLGAMLGGGLSYCDFNTHYHWWNDLDKCVRGPSMFSELVLLPKASRHTGASPQFDCGRVLRRSWGKVTSLADLL